MRFLDDGEVRTRKKICRHLFEFGGAGGPPVFTARDFPPSTTSGSFDQKSTSRRFARLVRRRVRRPTFQDRVMRCD